MSDYADELTTAWTVAYENSHLTVSAAIEGAVREALAKAAEQIESEHLEEPQNEEDQAYDAGVSRSAYVVRALGAKP